MPVADYEAPELTERIADALASMYPLDAALTVANLAPLDQFHTGGLAATIRLTSGLRLGAESNVLDVGSGLGGPARFIASTFGARVTGIDLSRSFVDAAEMLNARTNLSDRVSFRTGSALALPFPDESFDMAIMLHVAMNIAERAELYGGIRRVLAPGGRFLTYDVIERTGAPNFPAPWSHVPETSFLLTESATRETLESAGFTIETWDVHGPEAAAGLQMPPGVKAPPLGALLGRPDFATAVANLAAAIAEGRVAVLTALVRKA